MKNLFKFTGTIVLAVSLLSIALITSCKKDDPTIVKLTIVDKDGFAVKDANVRLYGRSSDPSGQANSKSEIRYEESKTTDGSGQVSYDLSHLTKPGQAGFMVLDIDATKLTQRGVGIIRVEEYKTNEKQIVIQ